MPSKSVLIAQAFSKTGVLSTVVDSAPSVNTGQVDVATAAELPNTGNTEGDFAFVQATNRLYLWSGSGWYNIALINTTPTWDSGGQPLGSYALDADSPQTATTITLAASDPEGVLISYEYTTGGQMDSIATISQDSSVFTITPKNETQAPDGGVGSITFRATDGVNILPQVSSFTLSFINTIQNSKNTKLLLEAVGTSSSNNTVTDSSSNNATLNTSGDAIASTYSPYRHGGYSHKFNYGGESYKSTLSQAIGNDLFTIEFWYNGHLRPAGNTGGDYIWWHNYGNVGSGNGVMRIRVYDDEIRLQYEHSNGYPANIQALVDTTANVWRHYAFVVTGKTAGSQIKIYVDGVESSSVVGTDYPLDLNVSITNFHIGSSNTGGGGIYGYLKDFRISNIVRYTANFTPPTETLTADSDTLWLGLHNAALIEEGTRSTDKNYLYADNGMPYGAPYSPFDNLEYDASLHGGSVYFGGGAGDQIATTGNSSIWSDSGTNTIEFWFNNLRTPTFNGGNSELQDDGICLLWTYAIEIQCAARFGIETSSRDLEFRSWSNIGGTGLQTVTIKSNTALGVWYHVAAVRNGQTWKFYLNGELVQTHTQSMNYTWNNTGSGNYDGFWIGKAVGGTGFRGYLSDFWVSNTEKYTSNFTPPTAPISSSGAHLHLKATDGPIIDKAQSEGHYKLLGNATGSTTQVKFSNTKSIYFDGNGDRIALSGWPPGTSEATGGVGEIELFTGEFTMECWIYPQGSGNRTIFSGSQGYNGYLQLMLDASNNVVSHNNLTTTSSVNNNQWHHIAYVRDSNSQTYIYIDGISSTGGASINATGLFKVNTIGAKHYSTSGGISEYFQGYMQDIRISDICRYTSNFTPPSEPLEG